MTPAARPPQRHPGEPVSERDRPQRHPAQFRDFDSYSNLKYNPLLDLGAWHGFLLPASDSEWGGFTGPMVIAEEYSLFFASELDKLTLSDESGRTFPLTSASKQALYAIPGAGAALRI